jgi:imidazole glycerol phosphate synthase subunit HisF
MKNKPTTYLSKTITNILSRLNLILFIVFIVGGLIFTIVDLNDILQHPSDDTSSKSSVNSTQLIDQTTLNNLNKLNASNNNSANKPLPSGRVNPLSE